ncbi:MAG: S41 family peptidase [Bdellovibrionota bacterium]
MRQTILKKGLVLLSLVTCGFILQSPALAQTKSPAPAKPPAAEEGGLECRYITPIEQMFLSTHVKYGKADKEIETRTVDQYVKSLDSQKIYFLQADVDKIHSLMSGVFEKNKNKECDYLTEIQKLYLFRVKERAEFAKKFLGSDYKFDTKLEFAYDPDKKTFPKTTEEATEFLKKYIHFQVSNYLATDMKQDEAKKQVLKNYDRSVKRINDTTMDDLYSGYLNSFAQALDPHSTFFSKDFFDDFNIKMGLSLQGIGATLSQQDGFTIVESLVQGGPAQKSGLVDIQDKIVAVGQAKGPMENVIDMDLKDVVKKIRGTKGTKVRLAILRKDGEAKKRVDVTITRDEVKLEDEAIQISYVDKEINGQKRKVGVINFPSFYSDGKEGGRSSATDMKKVILDAKKNKAEGLVVDLSSNGGGSLEDAVEIAGMFFKTGAVVKQTSRTAPQNPLYNALMPKEKVYKDTDSNVDFAGPVVLLTSRVSASASEILAGTLQDYRRAVIVGGDHTFGKGTIQTVAPLPNQMGALKVTIGMFYVPGGNSTQHRGVSADVVLPGPFSTDEVGEKSLDYSLPPQKLDPFISPEAFVKTGEGSWQEIKGEWTKILKEKSQARVDKSDDFKKIKDELKKTQERGKVIKISEVLKEKNEKDKKQKETKGQTKAQKEAEYLKRADINEAVNVLTDLLQLEAPVKAPQARN